MAVRSSTDGGEKKKNTCSYSKGTNLNLHIPLKREKDGKANNHRLKFVPAPGTGYITSRKGIGHKNAKLHSWGNKKNLQTPQQILCLITIVTLSNMREKVGCILSRCLEGFVHLMPQSQP